MFESLANSPSIVQLLSQRLETEVSAAEIQKILQICVVHLAASVLGRAVVGDVPLDVPPVVGDVPPVTDDVSLVAVDVPPAAATVVAFVPAGVASVPA